MKRFPKIGAAVVATAILTTAVPAAAAPAATGKTALSSFIETLRDYYRNIRPF